MTKLEERKDLTRRFMQSYQLDCDMRQASADDTEEVGSWETTVAPIPSDPFDEELAQGQIRVLSQLDAIVYVVLLRRWTDSSFLIMPFSKYSFPATDEEYLTRQDGGMYLRVLQGWNARTLQDETLRKSWVAGELNQEDLTAAMALWNYVLGDADLPEEQLARTGVPIYRADDPRLAYKQETMDLFSELDKQDMQIALQDDEEDQEQNAGVLLFWQAAAEQLLAQRRGLTRNPGWQSAQRTALAAADEESDIEITLAVEDQPVLVDIAYSPTSRELCLNVLDEESGDISFALDGCEVLDTLAGNSLGVIREGLLTVTGRTFDALAIRIVRPDGTVAVLVFRQEGR
ncbi:MAG: hypothetical protein ACI4WT_08870 [Oligosphaeraceae bacterium]